MSDLNDMLTEGSDVGVLDLTDVPMRCDICPDVETHVRLVIAARAADADDLRGLMRVAGLLPSPPPENGYENNWGKRRPRRGKTNQDKENQ